MIAVINDVSFQYMFKTKKLAIEYMHKFLDICKRIKKEEVTNVHEIRTGVIDTQKEISPDFKLIQLLQNFENIFHGKFRQGRGKLIHVEHVAEVHIV